MEHLFARTRQGANTGCYCGETILIDRVLRELQDEALKHGWVSDTFHATEQFNLPGYCRPAIEPRQRLYLSAGIHGDEPAGPLAALELVRQNRWPANLEIWLCPCLNPKGFAENRRENARGVDLNRDYRHPQTDEVRAHVEWLNRQPSFDLALILHEDWESGGFYLYELNPDQIPSPAEPIVSALSGVCPIEMSGIVDDLWTVKGGIIHPHLAPAERPLWAEAIYLIEHQTRLSLTLEAPSALPLAVRVEALVRGVQTAAQWLSEQ